MEGILSKTSEGTDMVERGYARFASAAQRIAQRQNVDASGSTAPGPPTVVSGGDAQAEEDDTSDRKRPRHGFVVEAPPSTDGAVAGAEDDQQAQAPPPRSRNTLPQGESARLSRRFLKDLRDRAMETTRSASR